MTKKPTRPKRPRDVVSNAIHVAKIATGEIIETEEDDGKDPHAKALGAKGGKARAEALSKAQRAKIAKKAAEKRWRKE